MRASEDVFFMQVVERPQSRKTRFKGTGVYHLTDEWSLLLLLFGKEELKISFKISSLNLIKCKSTILQMCT